MQHRRLSRNVQAKTGAQFGSGGERTGWIYLRGVKLLRVTMPKVHRGEIDRRTAESMREQLHLTAANFEGLYDCPFGSSDFQAHLERVARGEA
jgi:hypothetical protein